MLGVRVRAPARLRHKGGHSPTVQQLSGDAAGCAVLAEQSLRRRPVLELQAVVAESPVPLVAVPVASKKCGSCGLALPAAAFHLDSRWESKKGRLCNRHLLVNMLETDCMFGSGLAAGVAVSRAQLQSFCMMQADGSPQS